MLHLLFSLMLVSSSAHAFGISKADIRTAEGVSLGMASFFETKNGLKVSIKLKGLTPGMHGVHIHDVGKCEGPDFKSAGGHWNPDHHQHGAKNPQGHHMGDLGNIKANAKGEAYTMVLVEGANMKTGDPHSILKEGGTSVVVHEKADDEASDPAGASGSRIACGAIKLVK